MEMKAVKDPAPYAYWADEPQLHEGDRQFATTLARGLDLLRCFSPFSPELGNKDLSIRSGLPKPTVSRLTYTLTSLGYLKHDRTSGKYRLGSAVLSIGYPLLANLNIRQIARPYMRELANYANGWVSIGIRDRLNMVYIESARSSNVLRVKPDVGQSFPILMGSMGRAYIATLADAERQALINEMKVKTPDLWAKYEAETYRSIERYKTHHFCMRHSDILPDAHSVGSCLTTAVDNEIIAFNCAVPIYALQPNQLEQDIGPKLVKMVRTIEGVLRSRCSG
ncbi:IclR family transcriptional regulator [Candidimonas nitroreducens]|nr:IclR family transcriptional regulator [Candidimonas nitroreducens]